MSDKCGFKPAIATVRNNFSEGFRVRYPDLINKGPRRAFPVPRSPESNLMTRIVSQQPAWHIGASASNAHPHTSPQAYAAPLHGHRFAHFSLHALSGVQHKVRGYAHYAFAMAELVHGLLHFGMVFHEILNFVE